MNPALRADDATTTARASSVFRGSNFFASSRRRRTLAPVLARFRRRRPRHPRQHRPVVDVAASSSPRRRRRENFRRDSPRPALARVAPPYFSRSDARRVAFARASRVRPRARVCVTHRGAHRSPSRVASSSRPASRDLASRRASLETHRAETLRLNCAGAFARTAAEEVTRANIVSRCARVCRAGSTRARWIRINLCIFSRKSGMFVARAGDGRRLRVITRFGARIRVVSI